MRQYTDIDPMNIGIYEVIDRATVKEFTVSNWERVEVTEDAKS